MLLFHAPAVLAVAALAERGIVHGKIAMAAAFGFVVASALFAGDLTLRQFAGHRLFPFAAPTGGTLLDRKLADFWSRRPGRGGAVAMQRHFAPWPANQIEPARVFDKETAS